jgi:hypothetical protein
LQLFIFFPWVFFEFLSRRKILSNEMPFHTFLCHSYNLFHLNISNKYSTMWWRIHVWVLLKKTFENIGKQKKILIFSLPLRSNNRLCQLISKENKKKFLDHSISNSKHRLTVFTAKQSKPKSFIPLLCKTKNTQNPVCKYRP